MLEESSKSFTSSHGRSSVGSKDSVSSTSNSESKNSSKEDKLYKISSSNNQSIDGKHQHYKTKFRIQAKHTYEYRAEYKNIEKFSEKS